MLTDPTLEVRPSSSKLIRQTCWHLQLMLEHTGKLSNLFLTLPHPKLGTQSADAFMCVGLCALNDWMRSAGLDWQQQTEGLLRLSSFCGVCGRNVRLQKVSLCSCLSLSLFHTFLSSCYLFSRRFLPLRSHLRQFVFSLLAISAFLPRYDSYNPFPPFFPPLPPSFISPLLLLYFNVCVCVCVCVSVRHVWGVTAVWRSTLGYRTPPLSLSIRHSFLSLSLHLRNRESLPLGSRGNNEVPAKSGSSTTEQRLKTDWRARHEEEEAWETCSAWYWEGGGGHAQSLVARCRRTPRVRVCVHVSVFTHLSPFLFPLFLSARAASTAGIHSALFLCTNWSNYKSSVFVCVCVCVCVCHSLSFYIRAQRRSAKKK